MIDVAEEKGLTLMQALTLCLLEPGEPLPMNALAVYLNSDKSNVTGIVDRLVTEGYVERKEWSQDRRVKTVTLTKKGLEFRTKLLRVAGTSRLPNLDALSATEVKELVRLLQTATNEIATQANE